MFSTQWKPVLPAGAVALAAVVVGLARPAAATEAICATVEIKIEQTMTLERQAFVATMEIGNGMDATALSNVWVDVAFSKDRDGEEPVEATAVTSETNEVYKFYCRVDDYEGIACEKDGMIVTNGTVPAGTTAVIRWLIIPTTSSGGTNTEGTLYYVGATLSYDVDGGTTTMPVDPDYIIVRPLPKLTVDYFLPGWVYGDDPWTAEVTEKPVPFPLGVRVKNTGSGPANQLKIESAQPEITENKKKLDVQFQLLGASVQGKAVEPTLTVDFGTLEGQSVKVAHWQMEVTMCGYFTNFNATYTHADELGGQLTSVIQEVRAHQLVKDVLMDYAGRDGVRDFLASDADGYWVYESETMEKTPVVGVAGQRSWLTGPKMLADGKKSWTLDWKAVQAAARATSGKTSMFEDEDDDDWEFDTIPDVPETLGRRSAGRRDGTSETVVVEKTGYGDTNAIYLKIEGMAAEEVVSAIDDHGTALDGANVWVSKHRINGLNPWEYDFQLFHSEGFGTDIETVTIVTTPWVENNTAPQIGCAWERDVIVAGQTEHLTDLIRVPDLYLLTNTPCAFEVVALDAETAPSLTGYFLPQLPNATFTSAPPADVTWKTLSGSVLISKDWHMTRGYFEWAGASNAVSIPVQFLASDGSDATGTTVWLHVLDEDEWSLYTNGVDVLTNRTLDVTITNLQASTAAGGTTVAGWFAYEGRLYDLLADIAGEGELYTNSYAPGKAGVDQWAFVQKRGKTWTYAKGSWPGADDFENMENTVTNTSRRYYKMVFLGGQAEDDAYRRPGNVWGVIREGTRQEWTLMNPPLRVDRRLNRERQDYSVTQEGITVIETNAILGEVLAEQIQGRRTIGTGVGNPEIYFPVEDESGEGWGWQGLYLGTDGYWHRDGESEVDYDMELPAGKAFWLRLPEGVTRDLTFAGPVGNDGSRSVDVQEGWNLLGLSEGLDLSLDHVFAGVANGGADESEADLLYFQTPEGKWRELMYVSGWDEEGEDPYWDGHWVDLTEEDIVPLTGEHLHPGQAYYYLRRAGGPAELSY